MSKTKFKFFDIPTQVAFWDADGEHWSGGIAYGEVIICGCCGGIIEISEVYEFAPENIENPIHYFSEWIDLSAEIIGYDTNSEDFADLGKEAQSGAFNLY